MAKQNYDLKTGHPLRKMYCYTPSDGHVVCSASKAKAEKHAGSRKREVFSPTAGWWTMLRRSGGVRLTTLGKAKRKKASR